MSEFDTSGGRTLFEEALAFGERQVRRLVEEHPGFYPMYTHQGRWKHDLPVWTHWCDGFLPGMMWIFHSRLAPASEEARWWFDQAVRYSKPLGTRKFDREVHDLGFLFMSTYYHGPRRPVQRGDGRVPPAEHAAGLPRRLLLVPRVGLGTIWLRYKL